MWAKVREQSNSSTGRLIPCDPAYSCRIERRSNKKNSKPTVLAWIGRPCKASATCEWRMLSKKLEISVTTKNGCTFLKMRYFLYWSYLNQFKKLRWLATR